MRYLVFIALIAFMGYTSLETTELARDLGVRAAGEFSINGRTLSDYGLR